jgi:hypothetical protein
MLRKIGVVLCLLLFAGAFGGGQPSVFAEEQAKAKQDNQQQSQQKQDNHKQSLKEKYDQKVKQLKKKVQDRLEQKNRNNAALAVRG